MDEANGWAAMACSGKRLLRNAEGSPRELEAGRTPLLKPLRLPLSLSLLLLPLLSGVRGGVANPELE